ncbi:uncharacterized protein Dana_GF14239 [Drosophila ananassae]|uniref:Uncharacterized protein n=1 Tax=Drosophila ananassae TaxID=7217 RepID=B3MN60_DROAN|nr:uncharacterized protein LOC6497067 [Drosophila ananassae]EDV32038.2 uncharacterized protein Dana_GF14239 [Drosophila ananassae]
MRSSIQAKNTMRNQLILATICILLCVTSAQEVVSKENELLEQVGELLRLVLDLSFQTKGIEEKFRHQRDEIERIEGLETTLVKLETGILDSINITAAGVGNLTAFIEAAQAQNDQAIQNLTTVDGEIRNVLSDVEANQNKYEKDLDQVAASINTHLSEIEQLLRDAIVGGLTDLDHKTLILQQQQQEINGQVGHVQELNGLARQANYKLQQLECGLTKLNSSQTESLNTIKGSVIGIQVSSSQIDQKIGILLDNQKNIEKSLGGCSKWRPYEQKGDKSHEVWTHPEHVSEYKPHQEHKPKFETTYPSEEEATYLYKLWYGKGPEKSNGY